MTDNKAALYTYFCQTCGKVRKASANFPLTLHLIGDGGGFLVTCGTYKLKVRDGEATGGIRQTFAPDDCTFVRTEKITRVERCAAPAQNRKFSACEICTRR